MILLFGGTSDSRELAVRLRETGVDLLVSVVTNEAAIRLREVNIEAIVGRLDVAGMCRLMKERNVHQIVDASAPFAEIVSRNAMEAAQLSNVQYCRYERPLVGYPESRFILPVPGYSEAAETAARLGGRVLLTTGVKTLRLFAETLLATGAVELFVRFIPRVENMRLALQLGIQKQNILAMQGPFSAAFERALYENYAIDTVVTKEGGEAGSLHSKLDAVESLAIRLLVIERPVIAYRNRFEDMGKLIGHVCQQNVWLVRNKMSH